MSTDQTDSLNIDNDVKDLYESINKTITLAIRQVVKSLVLKICKRD
ncbi:MAG: hypothetical protein ACR5K3_00740 [Wolbachia sp.]|nr:hypothetical protein WCLE_003310 [Wolbachia endosymbiont of Cimex lectularius]